MITASAYDIHVEQLFDRMKRLHAALSGAGIAYRRRWFDLRLGGVARPYSVGGAGAHQGMTWGAAASAAARWPLGSRWSLVLAAGLDLLASRAVFSVNQQPTLSTAWVAPWLGAGLAWETSL